MVQLPVTANLPFFPKAGGSLRLSNPKDGLGLGKEALSPGMRSRQQR